MPRKAKSRRKSKVAPKKYRSYEEKIMGDHTISKKEYNSTMSKLKAAGFGAAIHALKKGVKDKYLIVK